MRWLFFAPWWLVGIVLGLGLAVHGLQRRGRLHPRWPFVAATRAAGAVRSRARTASGCLVARHEGNNPRCS